MSFSIKRFSFIYKIRNILIELLTHLYLQDLSSFSTKPCILIIYQNARSNSALPSITLGENISLWISHYGQYHNVNDILRQLDELCRSLSSCLYSVILLKIYLHPMGFILLSGSMSVHTPLTFMDSISDFMALNH